MSQFQNIPLENRSAMANMEQVVYCLDEKFGTTEVVGISRFFPLIQEKINNMFRSQKMYYIGSKGEGVVHASSDTDIMFVTSKIEAINGLADLNQTKLFPVLLCPCDNFSGYYRLQIIHDLPDGNISSIAVQYEGKHYVTSKTSIQELISDSPNYCEEHGPSILRVVQNIEFDLCYAVKCLAWPTEAVEWIQRSRKSGWPGNDLISEIVIQGCHVVPKEVPSSNTQNIEWRMSFVLAERTLIHYFNHTQFFIYNILKIILKEKLGKFNPDILCSYFLKTTMFWVLEEESQDLFVNENLDICLSKCLEKLKTFVSDWNLPNYFITNNNMLRHKERIGNRTQILEILSELLEMGLLGILRNTSIAFEKAPVSSRIEYEVELDINCLCRVVDIDITRITEGIEYDVCAIQKLQQELSVLIGRYIPERLKSGIHELVFKHILLFLATDLESKIAKSGMSNKKKYHAHKLIEFWLHESLFFGVTEGRLTFATYLLNTGRTEEALYVTNNIVYNYLLHVLYWDGNYALNFGNFRDYLIHNIKTDIFQKYQKCMAKEISVQGYNLTNALPALVMLSHNGEVENCKVDPVIYLYYVKAECFKVLGNICGFNKCVENLYICMQDPRQTNHRVAAYNIFGYLKKLQGDSAEALKYFALAYLVPSEEKSDVGYKTMKSASIINIVCLLHWFINYISFGLHVLYNYLNGQ